VQTHESIVTRRSSKLIKVTKCNEDYAYDVFGMNLSIFFYYQIIDYLKNLNCYDRVTTFPHARAYLSLKCG
jgi:hypothetical protein